MKRAIEKVLVPVDYSEPAFHAAWIGFAIARSEQASLTLMHIHMRENALREVVAIDKADLLDLSDETFRALLLKIVGDPSYPALQAAVDHSVVEFESSSSHTSDEICHYAKAHGIDMIVMGSHGRSNLEAIFRGSVSYEVVRKAHCPVTIVH